MSALSGRRILVAGSSRGAGLLIAQRIVTGGGDVILNSRDADALDSLRSSMTDPERVRGLAFDATDDEGVATAIRWSVDNWGRLDGVVHAVAARAQLEPATMSQDRFEQAMRRALSSSLNVVRAALDASVPVIVVVVPEGRGYARQAILGLLTSLAASHPWARLIAASETELSESALTRIFGG